MLHKLSLTNFRNHQKFELILDKITILVGQNGAGKSNVLEAISLLSSCRSFREDDKKNLVQRESSFSRIQGDALEVFIQKEPTSFLKVKIKGVAKKQSSFIGSLKSVIFSPETMLLVTGSPKIRRKFLDMMISQKDRDYLTSLMAYEKIKEQRNSLLQRINEGRASEDELLFWNQELIREGLILSSKRETAINFLNDEIIKVYKEISGDKNDILHILYEKSDVSECEKKQNIQKEIWQKRTLYGPHRDDIAITLNGYLASSFASRGEIRSAVLSVKIGELHFLQNIDNPPILLLDDVFSEFDEDRRSHLGELIKNYQTVITTTDQTLLSKKLIKEAKIIRI